MSPPGRPEAEQPGPCVIVRPQTADFQPFQGRPGREVQSPLTAGKLLQLWSIREQSLQPLTFIKPPSPSSVTVWWGCLAGHRLIKSGRPKGPKRQRGGGLWGSRERGRAGRGSRGRRGRANVQRTPVCFAIVAINAGKWHFKGLWWQQWWHSCWWFHDKSLSISYFRECGDSSEDGCLGMLSSCLLEALLSSALPSLDNQAPAPRSGRAGLRNQSHKTLLQSQGLIFHSLVNSAMWYDELEQKMSFLTFYKWSAAVHRKRKEKTVKFWILSRLTSFKEPIFSNTS